MKKIAIITINRNANHGNFLQNFALQFFLEKLGYYAETIINYDQSELFNAKYSLRKILNIILNRHNSMQEEIRRRVFLSRFKRLNISTAYYKNGRINNFDSDLYDNYIAGSDQIWNPYFGLATEFELLGLFPKEKSFSFAASFGVDNIRSLSESQQEFIFNNINRLKAVSVREEAGANIIKSQLPVNVSVNIDPTMLITADEWVAFAKKPNFWLRRKKYVLVYTLGQLTTDYEKRINEYADANNCSVIYLSDKKFFTIDPFEFIWFIKNAQCVFTDSFHANVFAIIFHKQFYIFNRIDNHADQNSRFATLHKKCSIDNPNDVKWEIVEQHLEFERNFAKRFLLDNLT